jgi:hypothetical protein
MTTTTLTRIPGFLDDVLHQAQWRAEKAAEYPDDERNANAAAHLEALAAWLRHGASDDLLVALNMTLDRLYADPDWSFSFVPGVTDRLGRLGFYRLTPGRFGIGAGPAPGPAVFDAEMMDLIKVINEYLEPEEETVEDQIRAAATDYVEKLTELEEEYLKEKEEAFYEDDEDPDAKDKLAEEWEAQRAEERREFFEMVKQAEADAWREVRP